MRLSALSVVALTSALSLPLAAQEVSGTKQASVVDESGPVVRRKLLYRSTRFEAAPLVGFTLSDAFTRNVLVGANLGFHLTNELSLSATLGYGVTQLSTSLRDNMDAELGRRNRLGTLEYSYISWLLGVEGSYVPLYGKLSLLDSVIVNYDFHLIFGVSFLGNGALNAETNDAAPDSALVSTSVAPTLGAGFRFFLGDMVSLNIDVRDYIYARTMVKRSDRPESSDLGNNVMLSIGLGIFLPGEVKVSR